MHESSHNIPTKWMKNCTLEKNLSHNREDSGEERIVK